MNFHHIKLAVYVPWDVFNMYLIQECPFTAAKNNDDGISVRTQSSQSISQTRIQLQLHLLDLIRTSSPWRFHLCSNCSTKALQSHNATTRCLWRWEFCKPKVLLDIFKNHGWQMAQDWHNLLNSLKEIYPTCAKTLRLTIINHSAKDPQHILRGWEHQKF
jgi:hypothetical protein